VRAADPWVLFLINALLQMIALLGSLAGMFCSKTIVPVRIYARWIIVGLFGMIQDGFQVKDN